MSNYNPDSLDNNNIRQNIISKFLSFFNSLKIPTKINLVISSIVIIFIIVFGINVHQIKQIPKTKDTLIKMYTYYNDIKDMQKLFMLEENIHKSVLKYGTENADVELYTKTIGEFNNINSQLLKNSTDFSSLELNKINNLYKLHQDYTDIFYNKILINANSNSTNNQIILNKLESINKDFIAVSNELISLLEVKANNYNNNINHYFKYMFLAVTLAIIIGLFFTIAFPILLSRSIIKNISFVVSEISNIITTKDLSKPLQIKGNGEISKICSEFNKMLDWKKGFMIKFTEITDSVTNASQEINTTTNQLNDIANNQSEIVEEFTASITQMDSGIQEITNNIAELALNVGDVHASINQMDTSIQETAKNIEATSLSVNEVVSSIEHMNDSIKTINNNSKTAQNTAENTVQKAKEGIISVNNTTHEMDCISQSAEELCSTVKGLGNSAEKIEEIVDVIEDIAEQTNLLSLNAAIEAARAGDAGRGFAVVATSIRNLAEKSSESTKDIAKLIKGIQQEVKNAVDITNISSDKIAQGVLYVKTTGNMFDEIFEAITNTSSLIQEITNAINMQESECKEITELASKMKQFIGSIITIIEEQATSSSEIVKNINEINNLIHEASAATEQQSVSSEEVVKLIQKINKGTLTIASGSNSITQSVEQMNSKTQELFNMLQQFKLNQIN